MPSPNAVCTIISKNYLSFARTFAESYTVHNPDEQVFVLLVDKVEGYFDPEKEKFTLIGLEDIGIENIDDMLLRYSVIELNTAVKPFFLEYLFNKYNFEKAAYFDPDIMVMGKLDELWSILDKDDIILTPHITAPLEDESTPSERNVLLAGTFNLGFIAVKNTPNVSKMLGWWQRRLRKYCYMDVAKGYHVDQKWINFVPYMFEKVHVLCDPGYNAAYWNLHERFITDEGGVKVNGRPIRFFHFSGFSPDNPEIISRHQNRFTLGMREDVRPLFDNYAKTVLKNGYHETKDWPYAYANNSATLKIVAERDQAIAERNRYINERDHAIAERNHFVAERDHAMAARSHFMAERDYALSMHGQSTAERDQAIAEKVQAIAEKEHMIAEINRVIAEYESKLIYIPGLKKLERFFRTRLRNPVRDFIANIFIITVFIEMVNCERLDQMDSILQSII